MNTLVMLLAVAVSASAQLLPGPVAVRVPSHDSAIIQNHRLGGNFAYSTHEAHAYGVQTPIYAQRTVPVGVSYVPGTPVTKTSTHIVTHQVPRFGLAYPQVAQPAFLPYPYALTPAVVPAAEEAVVPAAEEPVVDTA